MRFSKNANLSLSINAIVILILAITMLGLGLGFMKKTFGSVTERFSGVSEEIEKEMVDRMKESAEHLTLNTFRPEIKRGRSKSVFLAIRNPTNVDHTYTLGDICVGMQNACGTGITRNFFGTIAVKSGEVKVLPIDIALASDVTPDTYRVVMTAEATCAAGGASCTVAADCCEAAATCTGSPGSEICSGIEPAGVIDSAETEYFIVATT
ncbi:hypothetical protein ACFL0W_04505 [Nanoarchaeota archaeon]